MLNVSSNGFIASVAGDSETLSVALRKNGLTVSNWAEYNLYFKAKLERDDADSAAVISKSTGAGITVSDGRAQITIGADDTESSANVTLFCGVRGEHVSTGAIHNFADFLWKLNLAVVLATSASPSNGYVNSSGDYYLTPSGDYYLQPA